ncbi:MAG: hypothetical protein IKD00_01210 [Candidatus Methanomethylophilaceae archaeon]|nr:hypothetical protein [Candidatus Methanomethylophilaceae archaeon]
MNTKQIAVVGVVAVLIVAAVAVVIMNLDDGGKNADIEASLAIGGNVDNDYRIDSKDMEILDKILNDEISSEEYPLADVDGNGTIDQADKTYLQKILDDEMDSVFVTDSYGNVQEISYPLDNIITVNADMAMLVSNLGAVDRVAGYIASDYPVEQTLLRNSDAIDISSGRQVKEAEYKAIRDIESDLDKKGEKIGAIFYYSSSALGYKADFEAAGIPILNVYCTSPESNADAYATYGYLFGGEYVQKGIDMCQYCYNVYDHIKNKVGDREKVTALGLNMNFYVCNNESQYADIIRFAGGVHVFTQPGDGSEKVTTPEGITDYDGMIDYMFNFSTQDLVNVDPLDLWKNNSKIKVLEASAQFEDMVWINCSMPVVVRVAYVAEIMYPDLFEGYGDQVFQEFIDEFLPYLNDLDGQKLNINEIMTACPYREEYYS